MKNLTETLQEQLNEALQIKVDKAIKDMQKAHKDELSHIVVVPFGAWYDQLCAEIEQKGAFGPVATDCGKVYGIKK